MKLDYRHMSNSDLLYIIERSQIELVRRGAVLKKSNLKIIKKIYAGIIILLQRSKLKEC